MKDKKGFTLMELVVVIGILASVAVIFTVNMIKILNNNRAEERERVSALVKSAADAYVTLQPGAIEKLFTGFGFVDIEIGELRDRGLLSETLKDADTGKLISDDDVVRVKLERGDNLTFTYPLSDDERDVGVAWRMVAEPLFIDVDTSLSTNEWCVSKNIYQGLNDAAYYDSTKDYSLVASKMYLMDNHTGAYYTGDYFIVNYGPQIRNKSCNVNPQVAGRYIIVYTYTDPDLKVEKTFDREVYVGTD